MKTTLLFLIAFVISSVVHAQDSWKATLNGKTLLTSSTEDAEKNVVAVKPSALKTKKNFTISYTETEKQKGWQRTITAFDSSDHELLKQTGNTFKVAGNSLATLLKKHGIIRIFTLYLPTDPKVKASVRVRRVHLCTLTLK